MAKVIVHKGGRGSGNFGHSGRPGQVGGSGHGGHIAVVTTNDPPGALVHGWTEDGSRTYHRTRNGFKVQVQDTGYSYVVTTYNLNQTDPANAFMQDLQFTPMGYDAVARARAFAQASRFAVVAADLPRDATTVTDPQVLANLSVASQAPVMPVAHQRIGDPDGATIHGWTLDPVNSDTYHNIRTGHVMHVIDNGTHVQAVLADQSWNILNSSERFPATAEGQRQAFAKASEMIRADLRAAVGLNPATPVAASAPPPAPRRPIPVIPTNIMPPQAPTVQPVKGLSKEERIKALQEAIANKTLPKTQPLEQVANKDAYLQDKARYSNSTSPDSLNSILVRATGRPDADAIATIHTAFDFEDLESGFKTEVTEIRDNGSYIAVEGTIRDKDGGYSGSFERYIQSDGNVSHELMTMASGDQGNGFGSRFYQHCEMTYIAAGLKSVTIHANIDVGGYAWARMGFDFDSGMSNRHTQIQDRFDRKWEEKYHTPAPQFNHPWEFAAAVGPDGKRIGKETLLGTSWYAKKQLDPSDEGFMAGLVYYATK